MKYDLAMMAKRQGLKRRETPFAPIIMTSAYSDALAAISRSILAPWLNAKSQISEIYARELSRRLQQDSIDDLTSLFASLGGQVDRLILDLTPAMQNWAIQVEGWHRGKWSRSVLAGTDVDISTMIGPTDSIETIEAFMARQTALIRRVSDDTRAKIADLVYRGLQQRLASNVVGREIARITGLSRKRANRIAADQSVKLASALDAQRQREAGLTVWKWRHSGKLHYRPEHKARDGNLYADLPADRGTTSSGEIISAPPEPDDLPGIPPYCGCVRQGMLLLETVTPASQGAAQATPKPEIVPKPEPRPAQRGFVSPVNPNVTSATIKVADRLKLQKALTAEFKRAAADARYQARKEFRSRSDSDFGKAAFSAAFEDEAVSMIAALKPELDDLARQIGIPPLRGFKSGSGTSYMANQGDGVMQLNPSYFNTFAAAVGGRSAAGNLAKITSQMDTVKAEMQPMVDRIKALREEMQALGSVNHPSWGPLYDEQGDLLKQLSKLRDRHDKLWRKSRTLERKSGETVATWKPGDDPKKRPYTVDHYFEDGTDRARTILYHEFGHHVHQYLKREGPRRQFGTPPLERDLITYWRRDIHDPAQRARLASEYGTKNQYEWFAENFAAFAMGRRDLVSPTAIELIERIFNGLY